MSRMERVKAALNKTVLKYSGDVEKTLAKGKVPQDYSLGFVNAMIFCNHQINMLPGDPVFYERKGMIGALPKPVVLRTDNAIKDDATFQFLQDDILTQARGIVDHTKFEGNEIHIDESTIVQIRALKKSIDQMESFITDTMESKQGDKGQVVTLPDADCNSQEGSSPSSPSYEGESING